MIKLEWMVNEDSIKGGKDFIAFSSIDLQSILFKKQPVIVF